MMARTLAQDIEARVSGGPTWRPKMARSPSIRMPRWRIDIQRCDIGNDGKLTLIAEVVVEKGSTHTSTGAKTVNVSETPANTSTGEIVKSMGNLLGQLSDNVAAILHGG